MNEELIAHLQGMELRLGLRFEKLEARFEKIESRFGQLETRIDQMEERLDRRIDQLQERLDQLEEKLDLRADQLDEKIVATETRLLTEFYKWAQSNNLRQHRIEQNDSNTAERLTGLEGRVFDIEKRMNMDKKAS